MRNLKYKITILLSILVIAILSSIKISYGASWDKEAAFDSYREAASAWNRSTHQYNRRYSGDDYIISAGQYRVSNAKNRYGWSIRWDEHPRPIINDTYGVLCVEHSIYPDIIDPDQAEGGIWPTLLSNILVNGYSVYKNYNSNAQELLDKRTQISTCRRYAYITSLIGEYGPGPNTEYHEGNALQIALWREFKDYVTNISDFANVEHLAGSDYKVTEEVKKEAEKILGQARDYANMESKKTTVTCDKSIWKQDPNNSSKYIIGSFKGDFLNYIGSNSGLRFAGEYGSEVNGETKSGGRWQFCDIAGNEIGTIKPGERFYIKVDKSLLAKNNGNINFTLKTRERWIGSSWWELATKSGKQGQIFVDTSIKMWDYQQASAEMGPPSLTITKQDYHTGKRLAGVQFKLKNGSGSYYVGRDKDGMPIYGSYAEAKIFTSNSNGELGNIIVDSMGTYYAEEVSVGPNWQYEPGQIFPLTVGSGNNPITLKNIKVYMHLSGYAWEDKDFQEGKNWNGNELYQDGGKDVNDKLLANVTVKLVKNGVPIREVETDSRGKYFMEKIRIDDLTDSYIEFTYNGLCYQSVAFKKNAENGNKAIEGSNRPAFNERYTSIVPQKATGANNQPTHNLYYDTSKYVSKLSYGVGSQYGYTGQNYPINHTYNNFLINANTKNAYGGNLDRIKTPEQVRVEDIEELKNINLGVKEREQPKQMVVKDIKHVKVDINNAVHIYKYADRFNKELFADVFDMTAQVKYEQKYSQYGGASYTRALYPSDVYYKEATLGKKYEEDQLRVKVIYEIQIKNQAQTINSIINEMFDYYDDKYYFDKNKIKIGKEIDANNEVKQQINYDLETSSYNKYQKIHMKNINTTIKPETVESIYVQLEVQQEKIGEIVTQNQDDNNPVKLDNVAEIASYSIKDLGGLTYAGIDQYSQPGNANPNDQETYEDDTDRAPGLKLVLNEERTIDGKVFFDKIDISGGFKVDQTNQGKIRQGNGELDQNEQGIEGVTVELINKGRRNNEKNKVVEIYDKETKTWNVAKTTTGPNGEYHFEGFIPETYEIQYTWGGQTYKLDNNTNQLIRVQDYKGTIYKEKERQENIEWYKLKDKSYSDAMDNYETRQKIDDQSEVMIYKNEKVIEEYNNQKELELENGNKEKLITQMDSHTPDFRINIEYGTEPTYGEDEHKVKGHENHLEKVDFGITERPKQTLELTKRIKRARLVLADGNVLIDAKITKDPNDASKRSIENTVKYATYMGPILKENQVAGKKTIIQEGQEGVLKFELDTEIQQAARLEIEYELQVDNLSELDYLNKEFYHYGKGFGQDNNTLATLSAKTVIDYLDNNLSNNFEVGQTKDWDTYKEAEKNDLTENGLLAEELKQKVKQTNALMYTETLKKELKPIAAGINKEQTQILTTLNAYRQLPSVLREEDSSVGNNSEIIKVIKSGGSTITTLVGDYNPSKGEKEEDEATSEILTIIPATGLTTDYIAYTLLAISSLGILICGVMLIKKFVLK